jgi:hypothetical protein
LKVTDREHDSLTAKREKVFPERFVALRIMISQLKIEVAISCRREEEIGAL